MRLPAALALALAAATAAAAAEPAGRWGPPQQIPARGAAIGDARVVIDAAGNLAAVWTAASGRAATLYAAVRPRSTGRWQPSVRVSRAGADVAAFDLAVDPTGDVAVAYVDAAKPGTAAVDAAAGSTRTGRWRAPQRIGAARCCDPSVGVAGDGRGRATVLFPGPKQLAVAGVDARTGAVARIQTLAVSSRLAQLPVIRVNERGDRLVAWSRSGRFETSSCPSGCTHWAPPRLVTRAGEAGLRLVALADDGTALAVWPDRNRLWSATKPLYAPWGPPARVSAQALAFDDYEADPGSVVLRARSGSRALVVWLVGELGAASFDGTAWATSQLGSLVREAPAADPVVATAGDKAIVAWDVESFAAPSAAAVVGGDAWRVHTDLGSGRGRVADAAIDAAGRAVVLWAGAGLETVVYEPG